jgi:hypothetical protein
MKNEKWTQIQKGMDQGFCKVCKQRFGRVTIENNLKNLTKKIDILQSLFCGLDDGTAARTRK